MKPIMMSLVMLAVAGFFAEPGMAQQRMPKTETRTGTVKEVIQKGKARTLVVDCNGEELSFPIGPKVKVEVTLSGANATVLQKGAYLEGTGVLTNGKVFLDQAKVYLLPANAKAPQTSVEKPQMQVAGQSQNAQVVSGQIMAAQSSKEYPEYQEVALRTPPATPLLMVKKDLAVELISSDLDDAKPDQEVELEVIPGRNDKLTLVRATIEGGEYTPEGDAAPKDAK